MVPIKSQLNALLEAVSEEQCLTDYMRWKGLFLSVRFNILNGQPECDLAARVHSPIERQAFSVH